MNETIDLKKQKRNLIIALTTIVVLGAALVFLLIRISSNEQEAQASKINSLIESINALKQQQKVLETKTKELYHRGDSLERNLNVLWPHRSLVHNARLRDRVAEGLTFKPGDVARLKQDSSRVVITDILVGGNAFTYYVHYLVKTSKGENRQVSPFELDLIQAN
jgi:hypothetical protein